MLFAHNCTVSEIPGGMLLFWHFKNLSLLYSLKMKPAAIQMKPNLLSLVILVVSLACFCLGKRQFVIFDITSVAFVVMFAGTNPQMFPF